MASKNPQVALAQMLNGIKNDSDSYRLSKMPDLRVDADGDITNWEQFSNPLLNEIYTSTGNTWLAGLVNRIGLVIFDNKVLTNRLSIFTKELVPYGSDIEYIFENPARSRDFGDTQDEANTLLQLEKGDTKVVYHRVNYKKTQRVSISDIELKKAFISPANFMSFVTQKMTSLANRDVVDVYTTTRGLISYAVENNKVVVRPISDDLSTEAGLRAFTKQVRNDVLDFQDVADDLNPYTQYAGSSWTPYITQTDISDIVLVSTNKIKAGLDVDVLASAFNISYADFLGQGLFVKQFNDADCYGLLCDRKFIQIHPTARNFGSFDNPASATRTSILITEAAIDLVPCYNAVGYHKASTIKAIPASDIQTEKTTYKLGDIIDYRLVPANANTDVTSDVATDTINKINHTVIATETGDHVLSAGSATVTVTVTA